MKTAYTGSNKYKTMFSIATKQSRIPNQNSNNKLPKSWLSVALQLLFWLGLYILPQEEFVQQILFQEDGEVRDKIPIYHILPFV